jgi:hypothetical protein
MQMSQIVRTEHELKKKKKKKKKKSTKHICCFRFCISTAAETVKSAFSNSGLSGLESALGKQYGEVSQSARDGRERNWMFSQISGRGS